LVEAPPPALQPVGTAVYDNNATAAAVLTGIYDRMIEGIGLSSGRNSISVLAGLSADELQNYNNNDATLSQCYNNALNSTNVPIWNEIFQHIYTCNAAIEGISGSNNLTEPIKKQLLGEAKFMRAFFYFYLVNAFGNVPLIISTDYKVNAVAFQIPQERIYVQMETDLKDAQGLLNSNFVAADGITATSERIRPNKWTAIALLARIYLYKNDWENADLEASKIIANNTMFNLVEDLNNVFLHNSYEAIWQLQPVLPGYNTWDGNFFILQTPPNDTYPVTLSHFLYESFEPGDNRKANWTDSISDGNQTYYYPYKYKKGLYEQNGTVTEYLMVFRLAEQFLIRAEARAQQGDLAGAVSDLNVIRHRAGLKNYTVPLDKPSLLTAILQEKRIELFTEWGHRWFDIKRLKTVDAVMYTVAPQKGTVWNTNWQLYPIPLAEIQKDVNLVQNPGYK